MELVPRLNMTDAIYHAASRYANDRDFQRPVPNPQWVAAQLREIAARREAKAAERFSR